MTDGPRANRSIVTSVCMTFIITGRVSIGRCGRGRSETEREREKRCEHVKMVYADEKKKL